MRPEFKLRMYSEYFLPSLRFHLTVNDVYSSHLKELNALTDKYLKKWCGLPRPGTLSFIHMPSGLNIKTVYDLYMECHTNAYIASRTKADTKVNHCLDSQLSRESQWERKVSFIAEADQILEKVEDEKPDATLKQKKDLAKKQLVENISESWHSHIKTLVVQGRFLDLLESEKSNFNWRSIAFNLPSRICKFVINSVSDTLNTRANLQRWGKSSTSHCKGCGNHETLHHVLNHCTKSLNEGRFTWRHNNVLSFICRTLKENIPKSMNIFCDLEGYRTSNTTVPVSCIATNQIPDLCIYSEENGEKSLTVIELTISFELNIQNAHQRKTEKYSSLISDLKDNNVNTRFIALEIGSRGYVSDDNSKRLKEILKIAKCKSSFKNFRDTISKLAIVSSYVIYHAKDEPAWDNNIPLLSL